jgi:hypothetical protein
VTGRRCAAELRQAIDCLPAPTREAMLDGMRTNRIIVGAYTDRSGGICPMLAAHRHGGRTSLASFARAWDRYTGAKKRPRPASARELRTLRSMLETSLLYDGSELAAAAAEHRALKLAQAKAGRAERDARRRDTGERSRLGELRDRAGWAWLRVFRRYDEYQAALAQLESEERAARSERERERERV